MRRNFQVLELQDRLGRDFPEQTGAPVYRNPLGAALTIGFDVTEISRTAAQDGGFTDASRQVMGRTQSSPTTRQIQLGWRLRDTSGDEWKVISLKDNHSVIEVILSRGL